jgi:signal transduction histidine kinase
VLPEFIMANRRELIQRCQARVALRRAPRPTPHELEHGVPMFIDQLHGMLLRTRREMPVGGGEMERSAERHGEELLRHDFSIDQVVHDYGDVCQAITELAVEGGQPISVPEFSELNMTLDNAIAAAVSEWSRKSNAQLAERHASDVNERLGALGHEMRNQLNTAILALAAIKGGGIGFGGATAAALDRSMIAMRTLIDRALTDVRLNTTNAGVPSREPIEIASFLHDIQVVAALEASSLKCELTVLPAEPGIMIRADRQLLAAAVGNVLQNAFKFTHKGGHVLLRAEARDDRVLIEVEDECGGLPPNAHKTIFKPFEQAGADRSGMGLGLAISRKSVEENGGTLSVRDIPGSGCVFTIELPRVAARTGPDRRRTAAE